MWSSRIFPNVCLLLISDCESKFQYVLEVVSTRKKSDARCFRNFVSFTRTHSAHTISSDISVRLEGARIQKNDHQNFSEEWGIAKALGLTTADYRRSQSTKAQQCPFRAFSVGALLPPARLRSEMVRHWDPGRWPHTSASLDPRPCLDRHQESP